MSTKFILAALLCGLAILLAAAIHLAMIAGDWSDRSPSRRRHTAARCQSR